MTFGCHRLGVHEAQLIWPQATVDELANQISMLLALRKGASAPAIQYTVSVAVPPPPNHLRVAEGSVERIKERLQAATGLEPSEQVLVVQHRRPRSDESTGGLAPGGSLLALSLAAAHQQQLTSAPMSETIIVRLPQLLCATYGPTMSVSGRDSN